jgi:hypothetical protein
MLGKNFLRHQKYLINKKSKKEKKKTDEERKQRFCHYVAKNGFGNRTPAFFRVDASCKKMGNRVCTGSHRHRFSTKLR